MRAFLALDLPDETRAALQRVQALLPAGRRVPPDNLHLTLLFLDDQPEDQLEALHGALAEQVFTGFDLGFDGLGSFGGARPALLFAAVTASAPLLELQAQMRRLARQAGISLPRSRFRPHVTLVRFARGAPPPPLSNTPFAPDLPGFTAHQITLYQSTLTTSGARHDPLASYPLR